MGPTHKEFKKKIRNQLKKNEGQKQKTAEKFFLVFFSSLRFFSDSRKTVHQNSSG